MNINVNVYQAPNKLLEHIINNQELLLTRVEEGLQNQATIMATVSQLGAKVDELQSAIDSEQEQIAGALSSLQSTVDELKAQIVAGGTEEERQAIADKLDAAVADVKSTIADAAPVVEPLPEDSASTGTFDPSAEGGVIPDTDEGDEG
jgi:ABC-type transporter Mla subunit MlaD